jgi:hypothetical protein
MMDFISHNVLLSLGILFLIIMFLSGKISGLIVRAFVIVFLVMIVMSLFMGFYQKGTSAIRSLTPGKVVSWVVGLFGGSGGNAVSTLSDAGNNMSTGYRSCLYDAFEHNQMNRNGDNRLVTALKAQCPNATPTNQDAAFESCLTSVLNEYEPSAVTNCQSKYESPAGLTHSTVNETGFCKWFPSWCSTTK